MFRTVRLLTRTSLAVAVLSLGGVVTASSPAEAAVPAYEHYVPVSSLVYSSRAGSTSGDIAELRSTGAATVWVQFDRPVTRISFWAESRQCHGAPRLEVGVDSATPLGREIHGFGIYAAVGSWPAGRHKLVFRLRNDYNTATCDRRLKLYDIVVRGPGITGSGQFTSQFLRSENATLTPADAGATSPLLLFRRTGTATFTLDSQGTAQVTLSLTGVACDGVRPAFRLTIDGAVVYEGATPDPGPEGGAVQMVFPRPLTNGVHLMTMSLTNGLQTDTCNRWLRLNMFQFSGLV